MIIIIFVKRNKYDKENISTIFSMIVFELFWVLMNASMLVIYVKLGMGDKAEKLF